MLVKNQIIIAAISSRAYVQAAVNAGFEVIAIDMFSDIDTQKLAKKTLIVDAHNSSFQAQTFYEVLDKTLAQIDCKPVLGMTIGAGFEADPVLLEALKLIDTLPIFNTPNVIRLVKNPITFFKFLASIGAPYPVTQLSRPANTVGWLQKQIGGSGGEHIKLALPLDIAEIYPIYYQQVCAGEPYACLFLADGSHAQVIGTHQQWCAPTITQPYRFGGAVSHVELPEETVEKIECYVQKITHHFGLRGINSLDFMLHNNDIYLLEVNPRLSASLQLYSAKKGNLFTAHVQACLGQPVDWPVIEKQSQAIHIIYANKTAHVPLNMPWPDWVRDIPQPNSEIAAGEPLCTVVASARTAKLAHKKVLQRANVL